MTETPTDGQPGFVAEGPEHCHACYRLIRPDQTYYLTIRAGPPLQRVPRSRRCNPRGR
jgi:hypothetical protein